MAYGETILIVPFHPYKLIMLQYPKIHLQATGVETNTQTINVHCCACKHQLEYLNEEAALIRRALLENTRMLSEILRVLDPQKYPVLKPASESASVGFASESASVTGKNRPRLN